MVSRMCPCGSPQSYPIPHEHDLTVREKQIITYYKEVLGDVLGYAEEYGGMAFEGETGRTRDYFLQAIDRAQRALR